MEYVIINNKKINKYNFKINKDFQKNIIDNNMISKILEYNKDKILKLENDLQISVNEILNFYPIENNKFSTLIETSAGKKIKIKNHFIDFCESIGYPSFDYFNDEEKSKLYFFYFSIKPIYKLFIYRPKKKFTKIDLDKLFYASEIKNYLKKCLDLKNAIDNCEEYFSTRKNIKE